MFGGAYPSGGGTLGGGVVFGVLAGRHVAAHGARRLSSAGAALVAPDAQGA